MNSTLLNFVKEPLIEEFPKLPLNEMNEQFEQKAKKLSLEIEQLKSENPGLNYIECTVEVCKRYDVDMDSIKKVLCKTIKEKIELDAMELNLLTYKNNTLF